MTETDFHEERSRDLNEIRSKKEEFKSQKEILIPMHRRRLASPDRQNFSNTENREMKTTMFSCSMRSDFLSSGQIGELVGRQLTLTVSLSTRPKYHLVRLG